MGDRNGRSVAFRHQGGQRRFDMLEEIIGQIISLGRLSFINGLPLRAIAFVDLVGVGHPVRTLLELLPFTSLAVHARP